MWPVTERFIAALPKPHRIVTQVTYTQPGKSPVDVELKGGDVTVDAGSRVRRRANLNLYGSATDFKAMTVEGTLFRVLHGIDYSGTQELVPVFCGEVLSGSREFGRGAGAISLPMQDLGGWLARSDFITAFVGSVGQTRAAVIASIVSGSRPGTTVINTSVNGGTLSSSKVWFGSRSDAIAQLANDGGLETFFQGDGSFLIRDAPTRLTKAVWQTTGVLKRAARTRPLDKLYNTVVVQPSATDGSQTWPQQIVAVTDVNHPRHPSKIGVVPYIYKSTTAATNFDANAIAVRLLAKVLGNMETLDMESISNPALEASDVIRVATPRLNNDPPEIFQHFVDSFTLNLSTGSMRADTRSQLAVA